MGGACGWRVGTQDSYLSNHHRESEDTGEIVQQLEDNFKERLGVRQPPDSDEGLHGPVVAANVTGERRGEGISVIKGHTCQPWATWSRYLVGMHHTRGRAFMLRC